MALFRDWVIVNEDKAEMERLAQDVSVPEEMRLPARSRREEWAGHVRNAGFAGWGFGLALMFGVPSWGWWEKCVGWMDAVLWPLVAACGRLWGVVIIAAASAAGSLVVQYFLGDVKLMRVVKARTELLRREAAKFPLKSPRDLALSREANRGAMRVAGYSFASIGALLGPMLLSFLWVGPRVEFENAAVGEAVAVVASIQGAYHGPVQLAVPTGMKVVEQSDSQAEGMAKEGGVRVVKWSVVAESDGVREVKVVAGGEEAGAVVRVGKKVPPGINVAKEGKTELEGFAGKGAVVGVAVVRVGETPGLVKLLGWEMGWVWVYMLVYVPVMFGVRWSLEVP